LVDRSLVSSRWTIREEEHIKMQTYDLCELEFP